MRKELVSISRFTISDAFPDITIMVTAGFILPYSNLVRWLEYRCKVSGWNELLIIFVV